MNRRPRTIPVVAAFLFAASGIAAIVGWSLLFPNALLERMWELNRPAEAVFRRAGGIAGVLLLLLSAGCLVGGIGLLRARRWAWWFAVILFATNGTGDLVSLAVTGDWLRSASGVAIASVFLYCLTRPSVRHYFERA